MKIRIFSLAKELDVDSKVLIDCCQKLGIELKSSALASISPEERDRVLAFMKSGTTTESSAPKPEALAPTREAPARPATTRVQAIKPIVIKPPTARELRRDAEAASGEQHAPATTVASATTSVSAAAPSEKGNVAHQITPDHGSEASTATLDEPAEIGDITDPTEASSVTNVDTPVDEADTSGSEVETLDVPDEIVGDVETDSIAPATPQPSANSGLAPMRREDYMPVAGRSSRPMVSRSMPQDLASRGARRGPKGRPGPTLPTLAEAPPIPKSAQPAPVVEAPAQKPDMRLPKEILTDSKKPLQEHIRQHALDKKVKRPGEVEETAAETARKGALGVAAKGKGSGLGLFEERRERQSKRSRGEAEEAVGKGRVRLHRQRRKGHQSTTLKTDAVVEFPITIRSLSEAMGRPASQLVGTLMRRGTMVTVNSYIGEDVAVELAMEMGVDLQVKREHDTEEDLDIRVNEPLSGPRVGIRPPIVTILGHVDHGKTTLLDKIRSTNIAAGEIGGITQHIRAYQVPHGEHRITFLDTPGHAAFSEMRARGANVTDIAVLVVASNDGVMPQTIEAISHIRAANVPIVVAMNKIDLPDRNEQRVLQDLAGQNVLAAEWGGDTEVVRTSGMSGAGIDDLLETLLTVAELRELKCDPDLPSYGICLEAFRDEGRGVLAWLIVQQGTLRKGDVVLCGEAFGRIRAIYDDRDQEIPEAGPSTPVRVAGLDIIPQAGDRFYMLEDIEDARAIAERRRERGRQSQLAQKGKVRTLQEILSAAETGEVQDLFLIIKADTPGSAEALKGELGKFQHPEVQVKILHDGVGGVNESDVSLASASGAIIVAFHVVPEDRARALAEREGVEIREYGIIYEITEDIRKALEGMLRPEKVEVSTGRAIVLQTFSISRFGTIAGCRVLNGLIERNHKIRLIRDNRVLNEYSIQSLRRGKDDTKEVREGLECGIRLDGFDDVKEGDILQAFRIDEVKRKLE